MTTIVFNGFTLIGDELKSIEIRRKLDSGCGLLVLIEGEVSHSSIEGLSSGWSLYGRTLYNSVQSFNRDYPHTLDPLFTTLSV